MGKLDKKTAEKSARTLMFILSLPTYMIIVVTIIWIVGRLAGIYEPIGFGWMVLLGWSITLGVLFVESVRRNVKFYMENEMWKTADERTKTWQRKKDIK